LRRSNTVAANPHIKTLDAFGRYLLRSRKVAVLAKDPQPAIGPIQHMVNIPAQRNPLAASHIDMYRHNPHNINKEIRRTPSIHPTVLANLGITEINCKLYTCQQTIGGCPEWRSLWFCGPCHCEEAEGRRGNLPPVKGRTCSGVEAPHNDAHSFDCYAVLVIPVIGEREKEGCRF